MIMIHSFNMIIGNDKKRANELNEIGRARRVNTRRMGSASILLLAIPKPSDIGSPVSLSTHRHNPPG